MQFYEEIKIQHIQRTQFLNNNKILRIQRTQSPKKFTLFCTFEVLNF